MAKSENNMSNERYRNALIRKLMEFFQSPEGGEAWVLPVASNAFGFPFVNDVGSEEIVKITVSIPKGTREGEPYDLDGEAKDYQTAVSEKLERAKKAEEAKNKKIERDKKKRENLEKLKESRKEG